MLYEDSLVTCKLSLYIILRYLLLPPPHCPRLWDGDADWDGDGKSHALSKPEGGRLYDGEMVDWWISGLVD